MNRLPEWFRQEIPDSQTLRKQRQLKALNIHTVCREAKCPNISACFKAGHLTFMILGDTCTRACRFCAVAKLQEKPPVVDNSEPQRIKEAVEALGIKYAVITSVTRDDLPDGGAKIFSRTIELIRGLNKGIRIEALIPDFKGDADNLKLVVRAAPDILAHNIETVKRLYPDIRPQAVYERSLSLLENVKRINPLLRTKSSLMLGLGEREEEVILAMRDLLAHGCDCLTLGQYLAPSINHYPVLEFIKPDKFQEYARIGLSLGFKAVLSAPCARSSYQAEDLHKKVSLCTT